MKRKSVPAPDYVELAYSVLTWQWGLATVSRMLRRARMISFLMTAFTVASAAAEPFELGPIPAEGVLVLRNGQTVAGTLTRAGDHFFVALPEGEIRLRADDVEMACRDLDEAYARKRAVMPLGDAHRHIELAGWCLRHELLGPAASELADAMQASPTHPMIPVLRRRLEMAMHPEEEPAKTQGTDTGPSRADLDALVRRLPAKTVETFAADVQPLLMNNCTTAGCHGPDSQHALRLLRVPRNRPGGRRLTQQNLHSVLQWVDRGAPENSKLLTVPIEPHGGMDRPVFTQREISQIRQLAEWTARLRTPDAREEIPASVLRFEQPTAPAPPAQVPMVQEAPFPEESTPTDSASEPLEGASRVQRGAPPQGFVPADTFDPAIFNRQFFGEQ